MNTLALARAPAREGRLRLELISDGFVNHWQAFVPIARAQLVLSGVCLAELREGLIARNQVFFHRSPLLDAIRAGVRNERAAASSR